MPSTQNRYGARTAPHGFLIKHPLRGLSPEDIYELNIAKQKIDSVLSKKKSPRYANIRQQLKDQINEIILEKMPKKAVDSYSPLTSEQIQILRNEVFEMIKRGGPLHGVRRFRGKAQDGDPVEFFKDQYSKYIRRGCEVIFAPDLLKIDQALLTAIRNSVKADNMPIGDRTKKTEAIVSGLFRDTEKSQAQAKHALAVRNYRRRFAEAE